MWYKTGTITVTSGSTAVTGSGTAWVANAAAGEAIYLPDGRFGEIASVNSDTSITLASAYTGTSLSGQSYTILPSQSFIRDLAAQAAALINNYASIANNAGDGKFGDGTLGAPGISFTNDTNTGIRRTADGTFALVSNGVDIAEIGPSGMVLVTPNIGEATGTSLNLSGALSAGTITSSGGATFNTNALVSITNAGSITEGLALNTVGHKYNLFRNGTSGYLRIQGAQTGYSGLEVADGATTIFSVGSTGSATLSTGLSVTGALSATTSAANTGAQLHAGASGAISYSAVNGYGGRIGYTMACNGSSGNTSWGIITDQTNLYFASAAYNIGHNGDLSTGWTNRMTLDASGNLSVSNGTAYITRTTNSAVEALSVSAQASTATNQYGVSVDLRGDPNNATNYFYAGRGNISTDRVILRSNGGVANYSANNVNLSDERLKKDFNPAPSYYDRWKQIDFVTYLYKDQTDTELNLGVKAQQLETVCPELVDNSGFGEAPEGEAPYKAVYQTDFSYATAVALQEAIKKIESLEARLAALEAK